MDKNEADFNKLSRVEYAQQELTPIGIKLWERAKAIFSSSVDYMRFCTSRSFQPIDPINNYLNLGSFRVGVYVYRDSEKGLVNYAITIYPNNKSQDQYYELNINSNDVQVSGRVGNLQDAVFFDSKNSSWDISNIIRTDIMYFDGDRETYNTRDAVNGFNDVLDQLSRELQN